MFHFISNNYVIRFMLLVIITQCVSTIRFRPLWSNHGMEFEGWPAKVSIAALSHPSEEWYEKGQRTASTRTLGASWAFSNHVQVQDGLRFRSFF
jgi:hypothetical protein